MNPQDLIKQADSRLKTSVEHFENEIKKLRTGRAHPSMLEGVMAEVYGTQMPLNQLATISTPEPQLLQITPFDPTNLQAISASIRDNQSLGMNPSDDGRVVRVPVPALTEERRQQIVRQLSDKVEECMVSQRGIRRDIMTDIDDAKKDKDISEDDHKRLSKQVDDLMAQHKAQVDQLAKNKETEILTI